MINDEAHHAWRRAGGCEDEQEGRLPTLESTSTRRRAGSRGWTACTRRAASCAASILSATPFAPTGKANAEAGLFAWIVSDFGLNDAIEAGLVKTPRVVVRDDALPDTKTLRSKLYHLYRDDEVADDLNRRGAQAARTTAEAGAGCLHAARRRLARGLERLASGRAYLAAGTADGVQPYRNGGAYRALFPPRQCPLARTARRRRKPCVWIRRCWKRPSRGEKASADKDYEADLRAIVDAADIPAETKARLAGLNEGGTAARDCR